MGRNLTLAWLAHRFYWSGMADDVEEWLRQCVVFIKRKSPDDIIRWEIFRLVIAGIVLEVFVGV